MALSSSYSSKYSLGSVPMQQAFWLQYIAVMLIILTFLIGSFCMKKPGANQAADLIAEEQLPIANFNFAELFNASNQLNLELLAPFIQVLKFHDLLLRVELTANNAELRDSVASRAIEISQALLKQGLPAEAQQVVILGHESTGTIALKLLKSEER